MQELQTSNRWIQWHFGLIGTVIFYTVLLSGVVAYILECGFLSKNALCTIVPDGDGGCIAAILQIQASGGVVA